MVISVHRPQLDTPRYGYEYDVFLSFRGPDTRKGFTDCLYHSLRNAGIRAFRDNEELCSGDEIGPNLRRGITNSKICIPIFSQGYASSKWCLRELEIIAECRSSRKQIVMPVFFDVTPDQVKNQTGSYEEALRQHANEYSHQCAEQWRRALSELGHLKGRVLKDTTDGYQGQLIKLVVADVRRELKKVHLPVTKKLVGIDKPADAVMSLLEVGVGDVSLVGIYGISGIGKTTLAKDIYNKLLDCYEFEGSSSLDNIREKSLQPNGLEWLQSKLVADITRGEHRVFRSVDEGTSVLMGSFRTKKVLILLDDVNQIEQLNALVADRYWFGPGSRIIVTTTDGRILREAPQVNSSYGVEGMDHDKALELFNRHAFRTNPYADPSMAKLIPLANDIVKATGRIPLALEVIGRYLWDRKKEEWQEMLEKLRVRPNKEILDRLRISYDDLEDEYKQIFLDVACLFIGVDYRAVIHLWKDCQYFPGVGLPVLLHRRLIKIGEDNKLWMHDSLRDLGREIVRQENKAPEMRSRLWCSEEAKDILQRNKGTEKIEAISLQSESARETYSLDGKHFKNMSNLRVLRLQCADLTGDFEPLSELRWLSLQQSSFEFIPNSWSLEKLRILDMSRGKVTNEWNGWSSIEKATELKVLGLSGCHQLTRTPNLSMFRNLERLILEDCKRLGEVQDLKVGLPCLSSLNMKNCLSIRKLPDQFGFMKNLKELIINGTPIVKLPDSICNLENLRWLSANDCHDLKALPGSIGRLTSLVQLSLSHTSIETLPDSIGNLNTLEMLDISSSKISHFPSALGNLLKLRVINASKCETLEGDVVVHFGRLSCLEVLRLDGTKINRIRQTISELSHLQTLHLSGCSSLECLPELPLSLVSLRVTCPLVAGIPNLPRLINLKELVAVSEGSSQIFAFSSYRKLQSLFKLPISLEKLSISNSSIEILPEVSHLQKLSELSIEKCYQLREIPSLRNLIMLKSLKVSFCPRITGLAGLEELESLRRLQVSFCEKLEKLPDLSKLKKLSVIDANGCGSLVGLQGLGSLHALTELDIGNCKSIKSLPDLSNLNLLRSFSALGCEKLQGLEGLNELEELLSLQISRCRKIKSLPDLSKLKKLRHLNIAGCKDISEVRGLLEMRSLQRLVISRRVNYMAELSDVPEVSDLNSLGLEASIVRQIIAECRKRPGALREHSSAHGEQSHLCNNGLAVSISKGNVVAIKPYDYSREVSVRRVSH